MRDSNLRGTGHAVNFPKEWLPQKPPPTPPPAAPPAEVEDSDPYAAAKITGKSTMNAAKRKNYEKMLEVIVMEEQAIERERQRYLRQDEDALEKAKEAEKQRRAAILAEREARRQRLADRKAERDSRALRKRRETDRLQREFKAEQEARIEEEIASKTRRARNLTGNERPDGRLKNMHIKEGNL